MLQRSAAAPNSTSSMREPGVIPRNGGETLGMDAPAWAWDDSIARCCTFTQLPLCDVLSTSPMTPDM